MMGRIAPPREFEDALDRLVTAEGPARPALFETKQKALMFAAALGRWRGRGRKPVVRKGVAIRYDIFEGKSDDGFVDALAISETGDLKVLAAERDEDRITIFEEYVQVGLQEVVDRCLGPGGDPMEALLALVDEARAGMHDGIEGMDDETVRKLTGE